MSGITWSNDCTGAATEEERAEAYREALQQERQRAEIKIGQCEARAKEAPEQERKALQAQASHLKRNLREILAELERVGG